jgi:hypothetical protein
MNWKEIIKKRSWPNRGTVAEFCLKELSRIMKNLSIAGVRAEIRSKHFPNTSLEHYIYTSLLDSLVDTNVSEDSAASIFRIESGDSDLLSNLTRI